MPCFEEGFYGFLKTSSQQLNMKNYISRIREKIGKEKLIHPAARIIVENEKGEILFIERMDNGKIGIPAGALEENETISKCIIREVREETGIEILALEVIGLSSNPNAETVQYPNGDIIQYFTVEFYANSWKGSVKIFDKEEIQSAGFKSRRYLDSLPVNEKSIIESLRYYRKEKKIRVN
ncbi:MAG: ADP-ribose pyrophosphatase YjhB (NUDIX family) [Saprospiraceae bacterium]|jgi:ADP-ribose pyrophosphatase YjhB (NUDIX family)